MASLESIDFYAHFHPRWFESVQTYRPSDAYTRVFREIFPDTWQLQRSGIWWGAHPPVAQLPGQGWKLHIAVRSQQSEALLAVLFPILLEEGISFKFLLDPLIATLSNGKVWPRGGSGKFATIYPADEAAFLRLGERLAIALADFEGPYILSDRRWPGSRCVFYRYGGFLSKSQLLLNGMTKQLIQTPEGEWIPDVRLPFWNPPAWVVDPVPQPPVPASTERFADGRFSIKSVINFSNRGGVYKGSATDSDQPVILKEARPCIEVGSRRLDAIQVLEKEYRVLQALADTGHFARPLHMFRAWEHAFLVEEFLEGIHLGQYTILHNPVYAKEFDNAAIDAYFEKMRAVWLQLAQATAAAHKRGVVLGDLSFTNIIVQEDGIKLFDLETASEGLDAAPIGLNTPGMFLENKTPQANDYYALGVLIFGSLVLSYGMVGLHTPAMSRFLDELAADVDLPPALLDLIRNLVESPETYVAQPDQLLAELNALPFGEGHGPTRRPRLALPIQAQFADGQIARLSKLAAETVAGFAEYAHGLADTSRRDRLFPADLSLFETNPLSLAYGAGGTLWALHVTGAAIPAAWTNWVLAQSITAETYPPGLYLGLSGIAWSLSALGATEKAAELLHMARGHSLLWTSPSLYDGATGFGMACLRLWQQGAGNEFLADARRVGDYLIAHAQAHESGLYWPDAEGKTAVGYAHGSSGIALFFLYLSCATDDASYLSYGRQALEFDLAQGVWLEGKLAGFPLSRIDPFEPPVESGVVSCYWDHGSAGVGSVLVRYLALREDIMFRAWLPHLIDDCSRKYTVFPQLFRGLAGLGNFLLDAWSHTGEEAHRLAAWQAAQGLLLFRLERPEGITFPGDQLRRESADIATGAAGVALFLHRLVQSEQGAAPNTHFMLDELLPHGLRGLQD